MRKGGTPLLSHVFLIRVGLQDGSKEEDDICWVTSLCQAPAGVFHLFVLINPHNPKRKAGLAFNVMEMELP